MCKLAWASELCADVPSVFAGANLRFLLMAKPVDVVEVVLADDD